MHPMNKLAYSGAVPLPDFLIYDSSGAFGVEIDSASSILWSLIIRYKGLT